MGDKDGTFQITGLPEPTTVKKAWVSIMTSSYQWCLPTFVGSSSSSSSLLTESSTLTSRGDDQKIEGVDLHNAGMSVY